MKKDAVIAVVAIAVVAGICYGLSLIHLDLPNTASSPYSMAPVGQTAAGTNGHVIIRVNGEPVTEDEFGAIYAQMPEETQRQLSSPQGKSAFAEQLVRYKILEQEARRLGVDKDPKVAAVVAAFRTNILASAVAQKLVAKPTDQAVRAFYESHQAAFDSLQVSHILVAYAGGMVPPRQGGRAPSEQEAAMKAMQIVKQLRAGANFAQMAAQVSDDVASAERGGELGSFGRGQLPPEIEQRVFNMQMGQISDPIPSRFGVHVFLVGKRILQPLEKVRATIAQQVQQQNTLDRVEVLRRQAKVDFDPKFFPDMRPRTPKKAS